MLGSGLGEDAFKDGRPKKTTITFPNKEIYQLNGDRSPDQDQVSNFDNRQTEFSKSPCKRIISLLNINGLSKNKSFEEQKMERENDTTQGNLS
ncbi:MAG: hypothetical protein EZS28_018852 [Streblomastix strix]|uniref:Uncharacterized protein n=1 Tax=Streblomastix strix TaxID=222440 RepID=A0A5J4VSS0_9EUKA|nr:MAG: hypothetical protein EZS28_018852 [Streblomastix strix]